MQPARPAEAVKIPAATATLTDLLDLANTAAKTTTTTASTNVRSPATAQSSTLAPCREPTAEEEVRAAYALMQLAYADAMVNEADHGKGPRKRRASS